MIQLVVHGKMLFLRAIYGLFVNIVCLQIFTLVCSHYYSLAGKLCRIFTYSTCKVNPQPSGTRPVPNPI